MKGIFLMNNHKWKIGGMVISTVGVLAMVFEKFSAFIVFKNLNITQHYLIFEWIMLLGLMIVIYSKEKHDDERVKMIRLKSFQISFLIIVGLMMNLGGISIVSSRGLGSINPETLLLISSMGIILYLLTFHIGLYLDFLWEYTDVGFWENARNVGKNKWGIIAYFLISSITILIINLL